MVKGIHTFFPEINTILSFADYQELTAINFLSVGGSALSYRFGNTSPEKGPRENGNFKGRPEAANTNALLAQFGILNDQSLVVRPQRPYFERGNAYPEPSYLNRARAFGIFESFTCDNNGRTGEPPPVEGGEQSDPDETDPPCFVEPDSLFDGNKFPTLQRGETSDVPALRSNEPCNNPSNPPGSLRAGCGDLTGSPYRGR